MYSSKPTFVYGFHGIDKRAALRILLQKDNFIHSNNSYDWLGNGVYFWENNYARAIQYAEEDKKRRNSKVKTPFVLGAVIDLGHCLDLLDQKYIDFLKVAYDDMISSLIASGSPIPQNAAFGKSDFDFMRRELDCAVIRYACNIAKEAGTPFDSVRAAFLEGNPLYDGAKFYEKNHIQIAVINPDCIKGIFLPREKFH
ncbi:MULTISPECIES: hypothetical protein [Klebsiella]|uniref:hypothetical protein n=1 Tax=Klebsiella TaxID=570 RepID=UPI001C89835C|nr:MULTISPECIES: hypothetical protein [Klebsiella]HCM6216307.1 hypothetical protein [Klebsiella oxytoca]HDU5644891.1 hypothetical protein [Klebsiella pneumoniae subsp. pneumoniae]MBX7523728.1 hypothetical protein [Klebsiella pneumoniae]MBZ7330103.1 hypothetical protein [Klebsiella variicola]HDU5648331.1 hypothetical protein [Klebsiella pneumoniae subsp. pneumoniae]